jgi:spore coat polysaccharide biosynthesis predicted glycosyltransferase SpsG/2-C-methyl-D-erythritol 4-phosphate cytidylyltransferase
VAGPVRSPGYAPGDETALKDGLRVVAIVPARGGTDPVPYLNIKRLGDGPLLAHTLAAARGSRYVDRVIVSTDDAHVAEVARAHSAEVPFLRPPELAADLPSLKPVVAHAVHALEAAGDHIDLVVVLQATTPFREGSAVDDAIDRLTAGAFDTVVSVTEDRTLNWREEDGRLVPLFDKEGRREEQAPVFKENGAVVVMRRAVVDGATRFGERVGWLVLDKRAGFTVYDLEDFWMAERLLRQPRVLFRADGSSSVGMGHVFRSLAIAEALRGLSRADIAFLMSADHTEGLVTVSRAGYAVRVVGDRKEETYLDHIRDFAPAILINDLPVVERSYLTALSHLGATTVNLVDTIDDLETTEHYAQVIVSVMNQAHETPEGFYGGPAYAILREHFRGREKEVRDTPRLVLLSFGGSDPQGLTLKAARALQDLDPAVELVAVAGPAFSFRREFDALSAALPRRVPLINEAGGHIAELMLEADVMVGSGGMSVYEIAALGTPGIILGQNAREDGRMRDFAGHGTVEYLGLGTEVDETVLSSAVRALLADPERRRAMSARGRALVDGFGAMRAAEVVLERRGRPRAPEGQEAGR